MNFSELVWEHSRYIQGHISQNLMVVGVAGAFAWVVRLDSGGYVCGNLSRKEPGLKTKPGVLEMNSILEVAAWLMDKEPAPGPTWRP